MMQDREFAKLIKDIAERGLQVPVILYEGKILDGRHRARACDELGIKLKKSDFRTFAGDDNAALALVAGAASVWRRLNTSQAASAAACCYSLGSNVYGNDDTTQKSLADHFRVSVRLMRNALGLAKDEPAIFSMVFCGELRVSAAEEIAEDEDLKERFLAATAVERRAILKSLKPAKPQTGNKENATSASQASAPDLFLSAMAIAAYPKISHELDSLDDERLDQLIGALYPLRSLVSHLQNRANRRKSSDGVSGAV